MCVDVLPTCMSVCHVYAVPMEVRSGDQTLEPKLQMVMSCHVRLTTGSLQRAVTAPNY